MVVENTESGVTDLVNNGEVVEKQEVKVESDDSKKDCCETVATKENEVVKSGKSTDLIDEADLNGQKEAKKDEVLESSPVPKQGDDSAVGESMNSDSFMSPDEYDDHDEIPLHGDDLSGEKLSKTNLYIRGLSPDFNDRKLFDLCKRFGQIVSTKAIMHKQSLVCKGYGFVDFSTEEEAKKAVIELQQEGIPAQMARQQEQDLTNIYISNLPKGFDEKKLEEVFQNLGTVVSTRILRDQSGNTKRVGFVRMETQEMCEKVIAQVHNKPLEGYPECKLLCKFADAGKRRKPIYGAGGAYDHYDAYHQHNHHSYNYSNHQSAYTSYYANFPKGYQGATSNSHPSVNGSSPAGVPWSAAASGPAFGLSPLASTGALNYYNLLLANSAFGAVPNNSAAGGANSLLSANPLAAAATLGGAPYFQNQAAAQQVQLNSSSANANNANVANSAIGHSPSHSGSFLVNSAANHNQFSEASNMHSASQSNNGVASLNQNLSHGPNSQSNSLGNSMNGVDLNALYQQQSTNAQQLISNLSHSMNQMSFPGSNQRHGQTQNQSGGNGRNGGNASNMFYPGQGQGMMNGASSPLDGAQNGGSNGFPGNTPPNGEELQQHLKVSNGFSLNGNSNGNGFNGHNHFSASGGNGNGGMNGQHYWAALQQQGAAAAAAVPNSAAVAAYAAALASQNAAGGLQMNGNGGTGSNGDHLGGPASQSGANANSLHMMSMGRNGPNVSSSAGQLQY